jgi:gliding motility-associated-like protein
MGIPSAHSSTTGDRQVRWPIGLVAILLTFTAAAQLYPLQYRTEAGCDGVRFYFTNAQPGSYQLWEFGDGATSTLPNPTHLFPYGTIINVALTIDVGDGQLVTFGLDIATEDAPDLADLVFPNVFTPNGDGVNDQFGPITEHFLGACSQLTILNRYGQKLFDGIGNNASWDGRTFAGVPAVEGTYFYIFKVNGAEYKGSLSLLR